MTFIVSTEMCPGPSTAPRMQFASPCLGQPIARCMLGPAVAEGCISVGPGGVECCVKCWATFGQLEGPSQGVCLSVWGLRVVPRKEWKAYGSPQSTVYTTHIALGGEGMSPCLPDTKANGCNGVRTFLFTQSL